MTTAVSNREICSIKALLLLCEHGYFKKKRKWCYYPPPLITIRVKQACFVRILSDTIYLHLDKSKWAEKRSKTTSKCFRCAATNGKRSYQAWYLY